MLLCVEGVISIIEGALVLIAETWEGLYQQIIKNTHLSCSKMSTGY